MVSACSTTWAGLSTSGGKWRLFSLMPDAPRRHACGHLRRQALVVIQFQRFQQGMFRVAPHEPRLVWELRWPYFFDKSVILRVKPLAQRRHPAFIGIGGLFRIEQFAQRVPDLNHGNQTQAGRFILDRENVVIAFTECHGGFEDNLPALRLHAQGICFQRLEIRAADEVGVAYPDFRIEWIFLSRNETVRRKHVQPRGDFLSQIRMNRIGRQFSAPSNIPPEKASVPTICRGFSTK